MRNPLADKVVDIKPSGIRKFFDIVSEMQDAISLGVGEPDFDTPWHIRMRASIPWKRKNLLYLQCRSEGSASGDLQHDPEKTGCNL